MVCYSGGRTFAYTSKVDSDLCECDISELSSGFELEGFEISAGLVSLCSLFDGTPLVAVVPLRRDDIRCAYRGSADEALEKGFVSVLCDMTEEEALSWADENDGRNMNIMICRGE